MLLRCIWERENISSLHSHTDIHASAHVQTHMHTHTHTQTHTHTHTHTHTNTHVSHATCLTLRQAKAKRPDFVELTRVRGQSYATQSRSTDGAATGKACGTGRIGPLSRHVWRCCSHHNADSTHRGLKKERKKKKK